MVPWESGPVVEAGDWAGKVWHRGHQRIALFGKRKANHSPEGYGSRNWRARQVLGFGDTWDPTPKTAVQGEDPADE